MHCNGMKTYLALNIKIALKLFSRVISTRVIPAILNLHTPPQSALSTASPTSYNAPRSSASSAPCSTD